MNSNQHFWKFIFLMHSNSYYIISISCLTSFLLFVFRYTQFDKVRFKLELLKAYDPYVQALRGIILNTFYVIISVVGTVLVLKIIARITFKILATFDLIRQVKVYQTERKLIREEELPEHVNLPEQVDPQAGYRNRSCRSKKVKYKRVPKGPKSAAW